MASHFIKMRRPCSSLQGPVCPGSPLCHLSLVTLAPCFSITSALALGTLCFSSLLESFSPRYSSGFDLSLPLGLCSVSPYQVISDYLVWTSPLSLPCYSCPYLILFFFIALITTWYMLLISSPKNESFLRAISSRAHNWRIGIPSEGMSFVTAWAQCPHL